MAFDTTAQTNVVLRKVIEKRIRLWIWIEYDFHQRWMIARITINFVINYYYHVSCRYRMEVSLCVWSWPILLVSASISLPLAIYQTHMQQRTLHLYLSRAIPGSYVASVLHHIYAASFYRQYIIPGSVIIYCYYRVSYILRNVILLTLEMDDSLEE